MITGSPFADVLIGSAPRNVINSGGGADRVTGGGGPDEFYYLSEGESPASAPDTITDFSAAQNDCLNFTSFGVTKLITGAFGTAKAARFVRRTGYGEIQVNIDSRPDIEMIVKLSRVTSFLQTSLCTTR